MNFRLVAAGFAAFGLLTAATSASALVISLHTPGDAFTLPAGQTMAFDFDEEVVNNVAAFPFLYSSLLGGYTMSLVNATVGYNEGVSGYSGTLQGNPSSNAPPIRHYLTVPTNGSATLQTLNSGFDAFSFYMGSPDTYNRVEIYGAGGYYQSLTGTQLSLGDPNQQWSWGRRVNVDLGGVRANRVVFTSSNMSFELDNIAVAAVPEPATWALMIGGFGGAGAMLRRRRALTAA
jgi:hypothetical protein